MPTHKQNMADWAKRRKEIIRLSKTKTHRDIANALGITAQRVGQIIAKEKARTQ